MGKKIVIRAILFDLGNVLVHFDAKKAVRAFAKECKLPVLSVLMHFFTSPIERAYTRGEISSYEFYRHAQKELGIRLNYRDFTHCWNDIFWENKGMDQLLRRLKKKYPLYLISNTNALHFTHIKKQYKILRHFRKVFPSHEVGHRKPERQIYLKVLKAIRFKPEETLFIDDMPEFVRGARRVGMNAVLFRHQRGLIKDFRRYGILI